MPKETSFPKEKMKILILEGVHLFSVECFQNAGYVVERREKAMSEEELLEVAPSLHILGIRSKTKVTKKVLERAGHLLAIGCYCIGTDQVELEVAASRGVVTFNAPFSSTRSVAELTMALVVMLARKAAHRNLQLHSNIWQKSASGSFEVKNKVIGIVGYGHIGPQVGLLAESFGLKVLYYDIASKLALGTAAPLLTLKELLEVSDFVTLHVPETPETRNMISETELSLMKKGSYLLNLSRGSVVDMPALKNALQAGHLAGAAIDVYPKEPESSKESFVVELAGMENVILTPHIGGSTIEAQKNISGEVSASLIKYIETGSTTSAVNFPEVELPLFKDRHRVLNIHKNVPGVLSEINKIVADMGVNISAQYLSTKSDIGYLIMDVDQGISQALKESIEALETNIKTRLLF